MMLYLIMLGPDKKRSCGSDNVVLLHGRWPNPSKQAAEYADQHKCRGWTHYSVYRGSLLNLPDVFNDAVELKRG